MSDVVIKFDVLIAVLGYMVQRLRNNSMRIQSKHIPKDAILATMIGVS